MRVGRDIEEKRKQLLELAGRKERVKNTLLGTVGAGLTGTFDGAVGFVSGRGDDHQDIVYLRENNNKLATYIYNLEEKELNSIYKTKKNETSSLFGPRTANSFDEESSYTQLLGNYATTPIRAAAVAGDEPPPPPPAAPRPPAVAAAAAEGGGGGEGAAPAVSAILGFSSAPPAAVAGEVGGGGGEGPAHAAAAAAAPPPPPPADPLSPAVAAAAAAAAEGVDGEGPAHAAAAAAAPPPPPPAAPRHAAVAAAAAEGGGGGEQGAGDWWSSALDRTNKLGGAALGVAGVAIPAVGGLASDLIKGEVVEALGNAGGKIAKGAEKGSESGIALESLGAGWEAGADAPPPPPPAAAQAAAAPPVASQAATDPAAAALPPAAAPAAPPPAAPALPPAAAPAAAKPNPGTEEDELRRLQERNPGARLEVFCDDNDDNEKKKKKEKYDLRLEGILGDDYKKNKGSAFIRFISPSDKSDVISPYVISPHVSKDDFYKILAKDSFAKNNSNRGIRICTMDVDPTGEGVVMGCVKIKNQNWIDVKDEKNDTRIFMDKEGFQKLAEYEKLLITKFEEFLKGDSSTVLPSSTNTSEDKEAIRNAIEGFGSVKDIVDKTPHSSPAPQTSVASKLGLDNDEKIKAKAKEFADDFLQRRIMRGNLNCEKEASSATVPLTYENQEIGHIKIVRPHADPQKIEVYKVGNSNLECVNIALNNKQQIMQIKIPKITEEEITDVKYYNVGSADRLTKKQIDPENLKVKVNVHVKEGDNEWIRHKIRKGSDKSDAKTAKIVTPFEDGPLEKVPKVFTIGKGKKSVEIGNGTAWALGFMPFPCISGDSKISIKKKGDDEYELRFGDNKLNAIGLGRLSNSRGAYINNPSFNKIEGRNEEFKLAKKGGILGRRWLFSKGKEWYQVGDTESIKILVKDEDAGNILEFKISQTGTLKTNPFTTARNPYRLEGVSKVKEVPTVLDAETAFSPAPSSTPAPTKTSCWPAFLGSRQR